MGGGEGDYILVPILIVDVEDFEFDLARKVIKSNPPSLEDNTEELSRLAINKAKSMFKKSDFCNCNFK